MYALTNKIAYGAIAVSVCIGLLGYYLRPGYFRELAVNLTTTLLGLGLARGIC